MQSAVIMAQGFDERLAYAPTGQFGFGNVALVLASTSQGALLTFGRHFG
jgi:hypothetical protein